MLTYLSFILQCFFPIIHMFEYLFEYLLEYPNIHAGYRMDSKVALVIFTTFVPSGILCHTEYMVYFTSTDETASAFPMDPATAICWMLGSHDPASRPAGFMQAFCYIKTPHVVVLFIRKLGKKPHQYEEDTRLTAELTRVSLSWFIMTSDICPYPSKSWINLQKGTSPLWL